MRHRFKAWWLILLLAWVVPSPGDLSIPLSLEDLAKRADVVVHGRPVSRTCLKDDRGMIYTRLEIAVTEVWKGTVGESPLVVVQTGGTLGEESAEVPGQATFALGEETVLFLVRNPRGEGVVIGLHQGKFEVTRDASGAVTVHNRFHGTAPGASPEARALQSRLGIQPLTLDTLRQLVRGVDR